MLILLRSLGGKWHCNVCISWSRPMSSRNEHCRSYCRSRTGQRIKNPSSKHAKAFAPEKRILGEVCKRSDAAPKQWMIEGLVGSRSSQQRFGNSGHRAKAFSGFDASSSTTRENAPLHWLQLSKPEDFAVLVAPNAGESVLCYAVLCISSRSSVVRSCRQMSSRKILEQVDESPLIRQARQKIFLKKWGGGRAPTPSWKQENAFMYLLRDRALQFFGRFWRFAGQRESEASFFLWLHRKAAVIPRTRPHHTEPVWLVHCCNWREDSPPPYRYRSPWQVGLTARPWPFCRD